MNLVTILVTRSKACHVKTLHTILRLNIKCLQKSINNEITYVDDDSFKKAEIIQQYAKTHDRIFFIDFGISADDESIDKVLGDLDGFGVLVFPGVKEGVDWNLFKSKVRSECKEPITQMGLHFDTEVGNKISDNIHVVTSTEAKCWVMNTKNLIKNIKDKKGNWKIYPKMFEKFKEQGVKIYAFTAAKLTMTYTHECISNILNAAGVKSN
jgi:hypothetical protein